MRNLKLQFLDNLSSNMECRIFKILQLEFHTFWGDGVRRRYNISKMCDRLSVRLVVMTLTSTILNRSSPNFARWFVNPSPEDEFVGR